MKLLCCNKCASVFSLSKQSKTCDCGETSGAYYDDGLYAHYKGDCTPIGFNNNSLRKALLNRPQEGQGYEFVAFVIPKECPTLHKDI